MGGHERELHLGSLSGTKGDMGSERSLGVAPGQCLLSQQGTDPWYLGSPEEGTPSVCHAQGHYPGVFVEWGGLASGTLSLACLMSLHPRCGVWK